MCAISVVFRTDSEDQRIIFDAAREFLNQMDDPNVNVRCAPSTSIHVSSLFSISEAAALAGLIAVVARMVIQALDWLDRRQWDENYLHEVIKKALADREVSEFDIQSIHNLNQLRGQSSDPCTITAIANQTGKSYYIYIFRDGRTFTVELKRDTNVPNKQE